MSDHHTIFRTKRTSNFTTVSNEWIYNPDLSAKAKGILLYLLSKPDDWETHTEDIVAHMADGIDGIKTGIKELQKTRHLVKRAKRDERGKILGWETLVFEVPMPEVDFPLLGETSVESPEDGFPTSGKTSNRDSHKWQNQQQENPPLLNTDQLNTDSSLKTEEPNLKGDASASPDAGEKKGRSPSKRKSLPTQSEFHPKEAEELWFSWNQMYREFRGEPDDRKLFMKGFDALVKEGVSLEVIQQATQFYVDTKLKAVASGNKDRVKIPPDGVRFFQGKGGGESYCLRAYEEWKIRQPGGGFGVAPASTSGSYTPNKHFDLAREKRIALALEGGSKVYMADGRKITWEEFVAEFPIEKLQEEMTCV